MAERPLSVIEGRDPQVLQTMLDFYTSHDGLLVDATANRRRMWEGVRWGGRVVWVDVDRMQGPTVAADFTRLPFAANGVACLIFDPPHLPAAGGTQASCRQYVEDYGLRRTLVGDNVAAWFAPFLQEAARVLRPNGLIFAKLKDYVHNHKYQWQLARFVAAVEATPGLTPCDLIVKRDPCGGNLKSGRWQRAHHVRNAHCWWVVVRKGGCERG